MLRDKTLRVSFTSSPQERGLHPTRHMISGVCITACPKSDYTTHGCRCGQRNPLRKNRLHRSPWALEECVTSSSSCPQPRDHRRGLIQAAHLEDTSAYIRQKSERSTIITCAWRRFEGFHLCCATNSSPSTNYVAEENDN